MKSGSPPLIGWPWTSAERSPPLLGGKGARRTKEGRYLIAHAHEGTMGSGSPPLIGWPWTSAERSPPLLGVNEPPRIKEGTLGSGFPPLISQCGRDASAS
jgi:hypothetical protein